MPKLILNMIVKNEAKIITRCLDSVKHIIDELVIVDTGSTDGTTEVIHAWQVSNNKKGFVYKIAFINFAQARNSALDAVREHYKPDDFVLFMDAGMVLDTHGSENRWLKDIDHGTFIHKFSNNSDFEWQMTRIARLKYIGKWVGACHEYVEVFSDSVRLPGLITCHQDGGNQEAQAERYRDLLLAHINTGIEGYEKSRTYFYLAQTYFDLHDWENAYFYYHFVNIYLSAASSEEKFYAAYRSAFCIWATGDDIKVVEDAFLHAWHLRPWRIEPLSELVRMLRINRPNETLKIEAYQRIIDNTPIPTSDALFIERDKYVRTA